jgi:glycosyltransferase involved in cell wall biosynthesis
MSRVAFVCCPVSSPRGKVAGSRGPVNRRARIGINALFQASGGSLTNLAQLLREWSRSGVAEAHELTLFASRGSHAALLRACGSEVFERLQVCLLPAADRGLPFRFWAEQFQLPVRLRQLKIEALFCPGNVVPFATSTPTVVVFQNAAPFCRSVTFRSLRGRKWLQLRVLALFVRMAARRATRVIFISRFFRDLFVSRYRFPKERGEVIYRARMESVSSQRDEAFERSLGIDRPYVLCVSHLNPYKNILELIEGFLRASRDCGCDRQLVIAGLVTFPWYYRQIVALIRRAGVAGNHIILTGELPHTDVPRLLAGCQSFVFPSTCENCPTSLIEALSLGLPIGCSNVGVMPEIGGDAVLYFDPFDPSSIAQVLLRLMSDSSFRDELRSRAAERARSFDGEAVVAARTMQEILSVVH